MKKISDAALGKAREALRHPVTWAKGADLPEESIRPWEYLVQFTALTLNRFAEGFANKRNLLYEGKGEGKIPPNWLSVTGLINSAWDVVNDPQRVGRRQRPAHRHLHGPAAFRHRRLPLDYAVHQVMGRYMERHPAVQLRADAYAARDLLVR